MAIKNQRLMIEVQLLKKREILRAVRRLQLMAAAIVFLCSAAARCITGIVLPVDSGYLAR